MKSKKSEQVDLFLVALMNHVSIKASYHNHTIGQDTFDGNLWKAVGSIAEELGEVSTDLARQRHYGAVSECLDVAHSALLLACMLDKDGAILNSILRAQSEKK